jgi:hypothetical protein
MRGGIAGRRRFELGDAAAEQCVVDDRSASNGAAPSIVDLIKELRDESTTLVRQEIALAKAEMSEKASKAAVNAAFLAMGGVVTGIAAIFLAAAATVGIYLGLVYGLEMSHANAGWLAPLITAVVLGAIGVAHILKGKQGLQEAMTAPDRTIDSLKRDRDMIAEKVQT